MTAVAYIPSTAPFSLEQRAWLNGFLAGVLCPADEKIERSAKAHPPLLILYGSQTGSAERIAKSLVAQVAATGFSPRVMEANAASAVDWKGERHLLFVTSTWGDGEPPDNAAGFWNFLNAAEAPDLKQLTFAVLALGDKNYSDFCGAGRKFDERLEKLGATRLVARVDCDLDYEASANGWTDAVLKALEGRAANPEATAAAAPVAVVNAAAPAGYSRTNPFAARLLANRCLNAPGSGKETRHLEISLAGSGLAYEPGDALGVLPSNCPSLVSDLLTTLGFDGEEGVKTPSGNETSLRTALLRHYQVTQPPLSFVKAIAERSGSAELQAMLAPENKGALEKHLHGRDLIDLVSEFPTARFKAEELAQFLRPMNPRLYSIASSLKAAPDEVHLCVGVVRYEAHGRARKGVCSTFLADRTEGQAAVPVFVQASHGFRLPEADAPIIMIGPGTGIAPFRAFLQERRAAGAKGKSWLFFGDQRRSTDFLYQAEIEEFFQGGTLTRMDLAFSRDQEEKIYVQNRMLERAGDLFAWLEEGAHFYVCGDARRMARDVDAALHAVIQKGGGRTTEQAVEYVSSLKAAKRYKRDVY